MADFFIRRAVAADVDAIRIAHRKSILDLAAKDYPPEIVAVWGTNRTPEFVQQQKNEIAKGALLVWVVEFQGIIEGFSMLDQSRGRLDAIYVTGNVSGKGAGRALLQALEAEAKNIGLSKLSLESSITARTFYEKHGFKNLGHGFHEMRTGVKMECYFMEKILD